MKYHIDLNGIRLASFHYDFDRDNLFIQWENDPARLGIPYKKVDSIAYD